METGAEGVENYPMNECVGPEPEGETMVPVAGDSERG